MKHGQSQTPPWWYFVRFLPWYKFFAVLSSGLPVVEIVDFQGQTASTAREREELRQLQVVSIGTWCSVGASRRGTTCVTKGGEIPSPRIEEG